MENLYSSKCCFDGRDMSVLPLHPGYFLIAPGVRQDGVSGSVVVGYELLHAQRGRVEETHAGRSTLPDLCAGWRKLGDLESGVLGLKDFRCLGKHSITHQ